MQTDPENQAPNVNAEPGSVPPRLPAADAPAASAPPLLPGAALPAPAEAQNIPPARRILAGLLSACLALFLADAIFSLIAESLSLLFGIRLLTAPCGFVTLLMSLVGLLVYGLMGLTPMIPKRLFLPIALFSPAVLLLFLPVAIYDYRWMEPASWVISLFELLLGLLILRRVQGRLTLRWPLLPETRLGPRSFSWLNFIGFVLANLLGVLPAIVAYLGLLVALALFQGTGGFLALRPYGLTVQVRKYVRDDGKSVLLVPMAHIGEAEFYRKLSHSFPTNSVVLMEGVTDDKNLLTNNISYKRMATKLGLAEQQEEFRPVEVEMVRADVDVAQFTTNTIGLLNLAMLIHAKGLNATTVPMLLGFSAPPDFQVQFLDDLIRKRNQRLLQEIRGRLPQQKPIVVPWGVAHMPGIADGIKALGFRRGETREYTVIRFHFARSAARPKTDPTRRMAD